MAQPTPYTVATNFADDESANAGGRSTVRTDRVDAELAAIELTLGETLANLSLLQRDDGKVRDGLIELYNLSATALAALGATFTARGAWLTATAYVVGDLVETSGQSYLSLAAHTSGVFATDKAAGKWMVFGAPVAASAVAFTPPGTMTATNAQTAVQEVNTHITTLETDLSPQFMDGCRLSLTNGTPVTTSDVLAASAAYLTPHEHNQIGLYDSLGVWRPFAVTTTQGCGFTFGTANTPMDIFGSYGTSSSVSFLVAPWASITSRGYTLSRRNGVLVSPSDGYSRYLGTVHLDASKKVTDSLTKRHLFNAINRVRRPLALSIATASWNYTTATVRQANNDTNNQVQVMTGLAEDSVRVDLSMCAANTTGGVKVQSGIGVNVTNLFSGITGMQTLFASTLEQGMKACYEDTPAVGLNTFAACEWSTATGTTVWFGTGYGKNMQGSCLA